MKLGKTLIITGLLFSSVLGSVNVNNITAMAATPVENPDDSTNNVTVNYVVKEGTEEKDITNDLKANDKDFKNTIKVKKGSEKVALNDIYLPANYVFVNNTDISINSDNTVKVEIKRASTIVVRINFVDAKNAIIPKLKDKTESVDKTTKDTEITQKDFVVPAGYELDGQPKLNIVPSVEGGVTKYNVNIQVKEKKNDVKKANKGGHRGYARQRVRISFIDQDGNEAGYQQLNGKDTFSAKIAAPAGYSLVNSSDATIKFDKKGNKDIKINVTKNKPTPVMSEGIVTTNSGEYFHLYTIEGKDITNRGLSGDSKWYTDQYATINGEKMYRVATNEWVKATDVYK